MSEYIVFVLCKNMRGNDRLFKAGQEYGFAGGYAREIIDTALEKNITVFLHVGENIWRKIEAPREKGGEDE